MMSREKLNALLARHEQERNDLVEQLQKEEQERADHLRAAVNPLSGAAMSEALSAVERQIAEDRRAGRLYAKVQTSLPSFADVEFPALDRHERETGWRNVVVFIPRSYADGARERLALALVDVTDAVFLRSTSGMIERETPPQRQERPADEAEQRRRERETDVANLAKRRR